MIRNRFPISLALAATLVLSACETPRAIQPDLATLPASRTALSPPPEPAVPQSMATEEPGWRIEGVGARIAPAAAPSPTRSWSIRFDQAPIAAVADAMIAQTLRRPFRVDTRVQGSLTVAIVGRMRDADALAAFDRALRASDAALIQEGNGFAIVPRAEAGRLATPNFSGDSFNAGSSVYQARHVGAAELVRLLEPMAGSEAAVRADPLREQVYISGDPTAVGALLRTAAALDTDWMQDRSFQFFPVHHATPGGLAGEVRQILGGPEGPLGNQIQILEMDRLNGLLVIARTPAGLDRAGEWITRLDQPAARASRRLRSIPLSNLEAEAFVQTLSLLLDTRGGAGGAAEPPAQAGQPAQAQGAGGGASATLGNLRITADPRANALIMLADDAEYRNVLDIVRELDAPPPQVLIEATIAEVTLNDRLRFGVQWFLDNEVDLTGGFSSTSDDDVASSFPGFSIRYLTTDVRAVLNALSTVSDVQLLSTPRLLVLSNESAQLQVGDQVPIITQSAVGLEDDSRVVNTVQYRDTGVVLSVTPRVSENGRMFIKIEQEVSEVAGTTTSDIDSPTIQQRRLATRIQVEDGQLIVLGGLLRSTTSMGDTGVPYLSQIPGLGALFRSRDTTRRQTELVMFLRPTVVRARQDIDAVTEELAARLEALGVLREPTAPER